MNIAEFNRIWSAVYGNPAWSVKKGHGSFLTLEFGRPELQIREPRATLLDAPEQVRERLDRRLVTVNGQWHLWIYCCNWSIALRGHEIAHSESSTEAIAFGAGRLDGQKLLSVEPGTGLGSWVFTFDLGGELKTWPYGDDPSCEQWFLFERDSGNVLAVREDGLCSYSPGNQAPEDERWYSIEKQEPENKSRGGTT